MQARTCCFRLPPARFFAAFFCHGAHRWRSRCIVWNQMKGSLHAGQHDHACSMHAGNACCQGFAAWN